MPIGGVYSITNKVDNRKYVGASHDVKRRVDTHFAWLRNGTSKVKRMQEDYDRLGADAFDYEVHYKSNDGLELRSMERMFIEILTDDDYNIYGVSLCPGMSMEPLNEISTDEWVAEMRAIIDKIRPPKSNKITIKVLVGSAP